MITGGVGTYNYMPPERLNKKPYEYSADVWALGVLLYAMIAGVHAHDVLHTLFVALFALRPIVKP